MGVIYMRRFVYKGDISKLIKQNEGEVIDCIEGCLLDDFLVECKRGLMAVLETFETTNSSKYTVYFSKFRSEVMRVWMDRQLDSGVATVEE